MAIDRTGRERFAQCVVAGSVPARRDLRGVHFQAIRRSDIGGICPRCVDFDRNIGALIALDRDIADFCNDVRFASGIHEAVEAFAICVSRRQRRSRIAASDAQSERAKQHKFANAHAAKA